MIYLVFVHVCTSPPSFNFKYHGGTFVFNHWYITVKWHSAELAITHASKIVQKV